MDLNIDRMKRFFLPKYWLVIYIVTILLYIIINFIPIFYVRSKISFVITYLLFIPLQVIILIISFMNSSIYYKKDKRMYIYSIIPIVVTGGYFIISFGVVFFRMIFQYD